MRVPKLLREIVSLTAVKIKFCDMTQDSIENYKRTFRYFTRLHRLKIIKNKTIKVSEMMFNEYKQKGYKYIMYDTFFGASEGLKKFKQKLGFKPYKVKWLWEN